MGVPDVRSVFRHAPFSVALSSAAPTAAARASAATGARRGRAWMGYACAAMVAMPLASSRCERSSVRIW